MAAGRTELRRFEDLEELSAAAARALVTSARGAIEARGRFAVALSGGSTPEGLFRRLASTHREDVPWKRVHLFWSDERYLPREDPRSNAGRALSLLEPLDLPGENVHAPVTSLPSAEESARLYERELASFLPLDALLLGLGEDGHVASLFPGSPALEISDRLVVAVEGAPKPPPVRITMTLTAIRRARAVHVLVAGSSKRDALARALSGDRSIPAARVRPEHGRLVWWVDRAAWPASHRLRSRRGSRSAP